MENEKVETRETIKAKIAALEEKIFCINVGSDYLSREDRKMLDECYAEIDKLKKELKAEENGN